MPPWKSSLAGSLNLDSGEAGSVEMGEAGSVGTGDTSSRGVTTRTGCDQDGFTRQEGGAIGWHDLWFAV